ncbi:TonB-dependent receptor [Sphingomonas panacis]|uniref:TonB-dependent receptor n=1 Tax=Sphingomonas panacis TaxID=1560345 RepID=A0A1B3ZCB8_9SPHN|nr:TonB-dependent receptor [Sphingomonas panacis]AOH85076.1 TonB-dependent receptor [Sphingomonas panacis]
MRIKHILLASAALVGFASPALGQAGAVSPTAPAPSAPVASPFAPPGQQQGFSASEAPQEEGTLEDIVVTAQKREQSLQRVPVAVTAITADQLETRGVAAITDVARVSPSLTITENTNATGNSINLRGIGTFSFSIGIEPSVAIVVDDVALLQQAQAFSGLNDIARLEVLRGPQGTLFGKNASAGVINIVTQGPTSTLTGSVGAVATTDQQYRVEGMISGPVAQGIGFRLNAFYDDRDGYIKNLNTGHDLNGERSYGARARIDLDPVSNLNIALTGSYTNTKTDGQVRTFRSVNPGASVFGAPIAASIVGITPSDSNYRIRLDTEPENHSKQAMFTGRATLDLGGANLISITAYQDWRFRFIEDLDTLGSPTLLVPTNPASPVLPNGSAARASFHAKNFTQELRLVSSGRRKLDYLLALFYANGDTSRNYSRGPNAATAWVASATTETFAAFGQLTYNITDTTHIDGGLRFNRETIGATFQNVTAGAAPVANNASCLTLCRGKDSDNAVTYKVSLRQDLSDTIMAYASYSTGYKGQGFDISTGFSPTRAANPVRPETSNAYEVGVKSRFLDNKVQLNVTGFWTDFKDFQAQGAVTLPDGTVNPQLSNVGKLRSRGVEAELSAKPTRLLRIDASAAYTDAKIREFPNAPCYGGQTAAQGCLPVGTTTFQNLSGAQLANAPKFKYNIAGTYDVEFPSAPFDGFITAEFAHQSQTKLDLLGSPISYQNAYGVVNGSIGIDGRKDGNFRVAFFVNNLFDQAYATSLGYTGSSNSQAVAQLLPRNSRRYFGVRTRIGF